MYADRLCAQNKCGNDGEQRQRTGKQEDKYLPAHKFATLPLYSYTFYVQIDIVYPNKYEILNQTDNISPFR